jgi:hypothetical protein
MAKTTGGKLTPDDSLLSDPVEGEFGQLKGLLDESGPGTYAGDVAASIIRLLSLCWDSIIGSDETGMEARKVTPERISEIRWEPPVLRFEIERHGALVMGSTYVEIQQWEIDLHDRTAQQELVRRRQHHKRSPSLDVTPLAREIADSIRLGREHDALEWSEPGAKVRVLIGRIIPNEGPKQTVESRRKRLRKAIEQELDPLGWCESSPNVWRREAAEAR